MSLGGRRGQIAPVKEEGSLLCNPGAAKGTLTCIPHPRKTAPCPRGVDGLAKDCTFCDRHNSIFHLCSSSLISSALPCTPQNRCVYMHTPALLHSALCHISQSVPLPSVSVKSCTESTIGHTRVCPAVFPPRKAAGADSRAFHVPRVRPGGSC